MPDEPIAARIVAEALNRAGDKSNDGKPWTEEKVAAIYDGMPAWVHELLRQGKNPLDELLGHSDGPEGMPR
jgi:hypothetical protein